MNSSGVRGSIEPDLMQNENLTALDATFLELEEADQSAHMHIGAVMVFEPPPGAQAPTVDRVRADLDARLGSLPRFRQRLSESRTGGFAGRAGLMTIASTSLVMFTPQGSRPPPAMPSFAIGPATTSPSASTARARSGRSSSSSSPTGAGRW